MDDFYSLTGMVTAILDNRGQILEASGWQDICTKFHRVNRETASHCTESDLFLANNLKPGEYKDYRCKNGLWDVVTPLFIDNRHTGNIYSGQFFYDDEEIDEEYFIKQAEKYGFEREAYIEALRKVPKFSHETISSLMSFLVKFTTYISKIGFINAKLEKEIQDRKWAEEALKDSETFMHLLISALPDLVWLKDRNGVYLFCNPRFESFFGARAKDIVGKTDYDFVDRTTADFFQRL